LLLGLIYVWLIFSTASKFMQCNSAMIAAAVFLVPIYGRALSTTHHWFATLAVVAAVRVSLEGINASRLAAAGALLGLGSFFSLYHGLAGLAAFAGYTVSLTLLYSHYLVTAGLKRLWYFQVTYPRVFVVNANEGPHLTFRNFVVYLLLGAAMAAAMYLSWTRRKDAASVRPAVLLWLAALFLFAEVGISPNWLRIYAVSAPAVILFAWVIEQMPRGRAFVSTVLWVCIFVAAVHQTMVNHNTQQEVVDLPGGRVATTQKMGDGLRIVAQFTRPGDVVFEAERPGVYLPLRVYNPLSFDTVNKPDMPRPSDIESAAQQLEERRVPYVLWAANLDESCSSPCSDRLTPLREYIYAAYVPVATLPGGDTLWRRQK
jgi:hypothetical protein